MAFVLVLFNIPVIQFELTFRRGNRDRNNEPRKPIGFLAPVGQPQ